MQRVSSRHNPIVSRYRAAARGELAGLMLLDGQHLVDEALDAGLSIRHAAFTGAALARPDTTALAERLGSRGVPVVAVTAPVMAALSPVRSASPAVALADRPAERAGVAHGSDLLLVAADVQDPGNLGAIVRVAEAGGATGVLTCGTSADPFGWKALRGSMGSALRIPLQRLPDVAAAAAAARNRGCRLIAAVPRGGTLLFDLDLRPASAVLIGGEGAGLPASVIESCDLRATIPMAAPVESLNAAVAAALIVYEARRQRD
jgi:RNA methyltransferase, TrmH family